MSKLFFMMGGFPPRGPIIANFDEFECENARVDVCEALTKLVVARINGASSLEGTFTIAGASDDPTHWRKSDEAEAVLNFLPGKRSSTK